MAMKYGYQSHFLGVPMNQLSGFSMLWICTSIFVRLVCVNKMFDDYTGNWREISTLFARLFETFFYILVAGKKCNKNSKKMYTFLPDLSSTGVRKLFKRRKNSSI
jgi:hypothetical protein